MAEKKMEIDSKVFQLPIDVASDGIVTKTLLTADTYVDKNIQVTVTTPDAEFEIKQGADNQIEAVAGIVANDYTSDSVTAYPITLTANASVADAVVGVKTPGFAASTDTITVETADATQAEKVVYIKEGHLQGSGEASADGSIKLTKVSEAPTTGFYVHANASGGTEVDVAGWLPLGAKATSNGDAYYTVDNAAFNNTGASGRDYTDISESAPALIAGDYLYINEGYTGDVKISLAKLVPDGTDIKGGEEWLYKGHTARDDDGNLVTGTMGDATLASIVAEDATATVTTLSVAKDGSGFKVTGSADISGATSVAVDQAGYLKADYTKEGVVSGTANVNATLGMVSVGLDVDGSDIKVTPVISKEDSSTAKSGAITDARPESGRYIAVSTAAIAASKEVTPIVTGEGYGMAEEGGYSATGATITGGAAASGVYYVPVNAGVHALTADENPTIVDATATVTQGQVPSDGFDGNLAVGILTTAPEGVYITLSATANKTAGSVSGNVACTIEEGYLETSQENATISGAVDVTVNAADDIYIRVYDGSLLETL